MNNKAIQIEASVQLNNHIIYQCLITQDISKEELVVFAKQVFQESKVVSKEALFVFLTEAEKGFFNLDLGTFSIEGKHRNAVLLAKSNPNTIEVVKDQTVSIKIRKDLTAEMFNCYAVYTEQLRKGSTSQEALALLLKEFNHEQNVLIENLERVQAWWMEVYGVQENLKIEQK